MSVEVVGGDSFSVKYTVARECSRRWNELPHIAEGGDHTAVVGSCGHSWSRFSLGKSKSSLHILTKRVAPHLKDTLGPQPEAKVQGGLEDLELAPCRNGFP